MRYVMYRVIAVLVGGLLGLSGMEMGTRILLGVRGTENFLAETRSLFTSGYPVAHDASLGWVPRAGASGTRNIWGTQVTIDSLGIRSNGAALEEPGASDDRLILATGDSFTFGDQVSDSETWPAILQRRLGRRVINGGVFGYGFDQAVLRTERLVSAYNPETLILGLVPFDVERCELSERTAVSKPYFDIFNDELILRNTPTLPPQRRSVTGLRWLVGHSLLVHKTMMRLAPGWWLEGAEWKRQSTAHNRGVEVATLLLNRISNLASTGAVKRIVVLVQYTAGLQGRDIVHRVLEGTGATEVIDTYETLARIKDQDPIRFASLYDGHMTPAGNALVASLVADHLNAVDVSGQIPKE